MKIKNLIVLAALLAFAVTSRSQDASTLLMKSRSRCLELNKVYYEMTQWFKPMTDRDTLITASKCWLKQVKGDPVFGCFFHYQYSVNGQGDADAIYTGDELLSTFPQDSSAQLIPVKQYPDEIQGRAHNHIFRMYQPFRDKSCFPCFNKDGSLKKEYGIQLLGDQDVGSIPCYHISMIEDPKTFDNNFIVTLKNDYEYWISKESLLPVKYNYYFRGILNHDTSDQFISYAVKKIRTGDRDVGKKILLTSLPSYFRIKTYEPEKTVPLLAKGSVAPDWKLVSLKGDTVSLKQLRGKVVLLDFFYKSCYPCRLAIPHLQEIHKKYGAQDVVVVGIDAVDKKTDELKAMLDKEGVSYTVLLAEKDLAKKYQITGYPTVYILDRGGKVFYASSGFGESLAKIFEQEINSALGSE
ncbi:MAG: redoxin domain-containing protein [Bacteroidetes bacterium]|nr:redoxin domain-containing protein [Bacteroidota bacterium]